MLPNLKDINSDESYELRRNDFDFWEPWARRAFDLIGLPQPGALRIPGESTYPVLVADNGYVVKLYGEHWCGPESHAGERDAYRVLDGQGLPVPELAGTGELRPGGPDWPWPFVVMRTAAGRTWRAAADDGLDSVAAREIARRIGTTVRALATVPLTGNGNLAPDWAGFLDLLRDRRSATIADHREWGYLSPKLLDEVEKSLPDPEELVGDVAPVFVHGDLHGTNIFVDTERSAVTGLIDFTDAYSGDLRYSLVQLHLNAFRADRTLLSAALDGLGWSVPPGFAKDMLAFTFLHDFDVLEEVPLDLTGIEDVDELAELLWGVH